MKTLCSRGHVDKVDYRKRTMHSGKVGNHNGNQQHGSKSTNYNLLAWVSGVSGGKGERWKRKRERAEGEKPSFLFSPSPVPHLKSPLSPSPLGRPDTRATACRRDLLSTRFPREWMTVEKNENVRLKKRGRDFIDNRGQEIARGWRNNRLGQTNMSPGCYM